jgi:starvation-inducible DNA-binding protein
MSTKRPHAGKYGHGAGEGARAHDGGARSLAPRRIGLVEEVRAESCRALTQLLADTMALRDLYKKHHWQTMGPSFYELHLLYDKHYEAQVALMDHIAERIQMLGGTGVAFPHDVAEQTRLARPPRDAEEPNAQLERLLGCHEVILKEARVCAQRAQQMGDEGTIDLIVSEIIRENEEEAWFIGQQLGGGGLTREEGRMPAGVEIETPAAHQA